MRSLPFPRRLQLVKLLRAHGLRDVERLREDELKEALTRLSVLLPDLQRPAPVASSPPASITVAHRSEEAPPSSTLDDEDAWCLPRFREPKLLVPEGERTFLRVLAVKPRVLFFTWDLGADVDRSAPARLEIALREVLGAPPAIADVVRQRPAFFVDVDLRAPGWYVDVAPERFAVVASLVQGERVVAISNLALTPPARPAPPGPLWHATLRADVDRAELRHSGLLQGKLPGGAVVETAGEVLPEPMADELVVPLPNSAERVLHRAGPGQAPSSASMPSRSLAPAIAPRLVSAHEQAPSSSSLASLLSLSPSPPSSSAQAAGRTS